MLKSGFKRTLSTFKLEICGKNKSDCIKIMKVFCPMIHKKIYTSQVYVDVFQNIEIEFFLLENFIYKHHGIGRNDSLHQNHIS